MLFVIIISLIPVNQGKGSALLSFVNFVLFPRPDGPAISHHKFPKGRRKTMINVSLDRNPSKLFCTPTDKKVLRKNLTRLRRFR